MPLGWKVGVLAITSTAIPGTVFSERFRFKAYLLFAALYSGVVYPIFGFFIWGDVPDAYLLIGAAVVIASGLYILHRETTLARRRSLAAPAPV